MEKNTKENSENKCTKGREPFSYESILREQMGLFKMQIKMPVRDSRSLALVYTPGVAASCLEIKKDNAKALRYTNKMNAMLVVSDSSGFSNVIEGKNWNNDAVIPYLEAICVYYKNLANIDAYPLVLDFSKISSEEELLETVNAVMPSYSAIEFFSMCPDRLKGFYDLIGKSEKKSFAYFDSNRKRSLDESLKKKEISFSANGIYSAVLRVILDAQVYGELNNILDATVNYVLENSPKCYFQILKFVSDYVISNKLSSLNSNEFNLNKEELSSDYIMRKYKSYVIYGESSWVDTFPQGYYNHKKTNDENSLLLHGRYKGVVAGGSKLNIKTRQELDNLITWENLDGISKILLENPEEAIHLTCKRNLGAIITNGSAILGLGNIGALAGLPVMEGKSVLFKLYGGTDVIPFCIQESNPEKFVTICSRITPIFSIINLEDIKSPDCFIIEPKLNEITDYPIFHDDQHGTAVVVLAGLINALRLRGTNISDARIVMNGAGAAGLSITELLLRYGAKNYIICDTEGAIYKGREKNMNEFKNKLAEMTNSNGEKGKLDEIIKGADIFIGVSGPRLLSQDMVRSMAPKPIVFALANPTPEIFPDEAIEAGAFVVATGRSDFPNQINNSLAFPGIFRAAVDVRARNITIDMKLAASMKIAELVPENKLRTDYIVPGSLDTAVSMSVCQAVAEVAILNGESRSTEFDADLVRQDIFTWFSEEKLMNLEKINKTKFDWQI